MIEVTTEDRIPGIKSQPRKRPGRNPADVDWTANVPEWLTSSELRRGKRELRANDVWLRNVMRDKRLFASTRLVAVAVSWHLDFDTVDSMFAGPTKLALESGKSLPTVKRALAELVAAGWLEQVNKASSEAGTSTYRGTRPTVERVSAEPVNASPDGSALTLTRISAEPVPVSALSRKGVSADTQDVQIATSRSYQEHPASLGGAGGAARSPRKGNAKEAMLARVAGAIARHPQFEPALDEYLAGPQDDGAFSMTVHELAEVTGFDDDQTWPMLAVLTGIHDLTTRRERDEAREWLESPES